MSSNLNATSFGAFGTNQNQVHFTHVIEGVYGTFATPAGTVCYLQTKARVKADGTSHANLTRALVPAREALNIQEMNFNQLLQRDLDDHRIATKLIPYILNPPVNSLPGFFPPIVAVVLPFKSTQEPEENFPEPDESFGDDPLYGARFKITSHGRAFREQIMVDANNQPSPHSLAVLRWNPDAAKLVIMDGQHRAMALLAIERTVNKSWSNFPKGARYQPFYEQHVEKWLSKAKQEGQPIDLANIELPVTICWFPDSPGQAIRPKPHMSARKLFVDVNNTAKPPSAARLVLLSDTQLDNIFARELLNRLRRDSQWASQFPLFGVEYDNPDKASSNPRRWSVVTSLDILKDAVVRTVFGPPKIIENPSASLQGKPATSLMDRRMRNQLQVDKLFPKEFHDGSRLMSREGLGNESFPLNDQVLHDKLLDSFYSQWGEGILHLLANVEPYRAHLKALQDLYVTWTVADNVQTLAKDALFEGVGMLWTIEDGHQLWIDECREARQEKRKEPAQPDISRAWTILAKDQSEAFSQRRADIYLNTKDPDKIFECDTLYKSLITYAAQVGLMLGWASLRHHAAPDANPTELAKKLALAINKSFQSGPTANRDRKRILLKRSRDAAFKPLNDLPKLEPVFASHYRYLWLELALLEHNRQDLEGAGVDWAKAIKLLDSCRQVYLKLLVVERTKRKMNDAAVKALALFRDQEAKALELADQEVQDEQSEAHKYWFGGTIVECRKKIADTLSQKPIVTDQEGAEEEGAEEEGAVLADDTEPED